MIQRLFTRHSIRERLLIAMLSMVVTLLATLTFIQIQSQQEILRDELSRREQLMTEKTLQQSKSLSQNLARQVEIELSAFNFSQASELINTAVIENSDLKYGILMESNQVAHIHTHNKALELETLKKPEDDAAAKFTEPGSQSLMEGNEKLIEFIEPVKISAQPWGVLRLGFSMKQVTAEIENSQQEITEQIQSIITNSLLTTALFLLIGLGVVIMIAARISQPLIQLTRSARELAAGNFSTELAINTRKDDEIGQLSRAFSEMARDLKYSYQQLEESNLTLEQRVEERTAELNNLVEQLRQTNEELEQSQAELARAERMASLGRLVAGVAHEINTPVGIGITCASHLRETTENVARLFNEGTIKKGDFRKYLDTATESCELVLNNLNRTGDLVKSFKMVSADQTSEERREYDLHAYLSDILLSLGPNLKKNNHSVELHCPIGIEMDGYPGALAQVITNLVMNSLNHAFDPGQKGYMEINATALDNDTVEISYTDDGRGISEEHISKIFDPFFTTKRGEGGTGLGLNIVYNLVHDTLRGELSCTSKLGEGIRFDIKIPRRINEEFAIEQTQLRH
ncbi:MAG: ATP-binding protein [Pseudomonadota bacterium]